MTFYCQEFVKLLDLKPGQIVLDVGSGIGGSAFYMSDNFQTKVLGIDLSSNMTSIGWERTQEINDDRVCICVIYWNTHLTQQAAMKVNC